MGNTTRRVHMVAARSDKGSPRSRSLGRIRGVASVFRLPMAASAPECFPSPPAAVLALTQHRCRRRIPPSSAPRSTSPTTSPEVSTPTDHPGAWNRGTGATLEVGGQLGVADMRWGGEGALEDPDALADTGRERDTEGDALPEACLEGDADGDAVDVEEGAKEGLGDADAVDVEGGEREGLGDAEAPSEREVVGEADTGEDPVTVGVRDDDIEREVVDVLEGLLDTGADSLRERDNDFEREGDGDRERVGEDVRDEVGDEVCDEEGEELDVRVRVPQLFVGEGDGLADRLG